MTGWYLGVGLAWLVISCLLGIVVGTIIRRSGEDD